MSALLMILFIFIFVALFGAALVVISAKLGPKLKYNKVKSESYECGIEEQLSGHSKIPVKYYLTAILFILFDIEIVFMYPWAVAYGDFIKEGHGLYILLGMSVFLAIFIFGLFWEVKSKALEWE